MDKVMFATGHRPNKLGGYHYDVLRKLVLFANNQLAFFKPERMITGGAQGWDTAVAIAALQLSIPLTLVIPFETFHSRWVRDQSFRSWEKVLSRATEVITLQTSVPVDLSQASLWLQQRNEYMVDHASMGLALWNGTRGGTQNCIEYARRKVVKVHNCWASWEQFAKLK